MYLGYWGMRRRPFDNTHDAESFVPVSVAEVAQVKLRYAVEAGLGASLVTGPAGCGKTELVKLLLAGLDETNWASAYLANPGGERDGVLTLAADLLGSPGAPAGQSPLETLLARLAYLMQEGRRACLAVDEIHTVSDLSILETLRMLLNVEYRGQRAVNLVLAGQPGCEALLEQASGFLTHVALRIVLAPMNMEDTKKYMLYRLKAVGCNRGIFTRHAAEMVHALSGGVPRNVNRICELCLVTGFGFGVNKVTPDIVTMAAEDLGIDTSLAEADAKAAPAPAATEDILANLSPE